MYRVPLTLHKALQEGQNPVIYCVIDTGMGKRVYSGKELTCTISSALEKSARVVSFGSFERTIQPKRSDVLTAYGDKQTQHLSMQFDNADGYFARMVAKEPLVGATLSVRFGLESDTSTSHISIFSGTISEVSLLPTMTIEVDDR